MGNYRRHMEHWTGICICSYILSAATFMAHPLQSTLLIGLLLLILAVTIYIFKVVGNSRSFDDKPTSVLGV